MESAHKAIKVSRKSKAVMKFADVMVVLELLPSNLWL